MGTRQTEPMAQASAMSKRQGELVQKTLRGAGSDGLAVGSESFPEVSYLKRTCDHLRSQKRQIQQHLVNLESRMRSMEQLQLKARYQECADLNGGGMEITSLHEQLDAVLLLKDALNRENLELQRRAQIAEERAKSDQLECGACVICMESLSDVVCLPCKHLALCSFCKQQQCLKSCPICRQSIDDTLQIFVP